MSPQTTHQPRALFSATRHRASSSKRNVRTLVQVMLGVMQQELGTEALARWKDTLDAQLGDNLFGSLKALKAKAAQPRPIGPVVMASWVPNHPKIARLLLEAFQHGDEPLPDGKPVRIHTTTADGRSLSKVMAKRAIEWVQHRHPNALQLTGELTAEQLGDPFRFQRVVGRSATDLMAYLHSLASAECAASDAEASADELTDDDAVIMTVMELHRTDERLAGPETRGSGLVVCERGWSLLGRAIAKTLETLR